MSQSSEMKKRIAAVLSLLAMGLWNCAPALPDPETSNSAVCRVPGEYQSVSPFGYPICQKDYADAGKPCRGEADCEGRCLGEVPEDVRSVRVGDPLAGRCEAQRSTFGCHGHVEDGKLARPFICED